MNGHQLQFQHSLAPAIPNGTEIILLFFTSDASALFCVCDVFSLSFRNCSGTILRSPTGLLKTKLNNFKIAHTNNDSKSKNYMLLLLCLVT